MGYNLSTALSGVGSSRDREFLYKTLTAVYDKLSSQCHTSAGLVIASTVQLAKTGAANTYGTVHGTPFSIAAGTNMAPLVGTVTNGYFNVFVFYIDQFGNLTSAAGTQATTLSGVVFPAQLKKTAMIGYIIINPTGTGNFVGGTTGLADATVVPNTVYVNTIGAVDPTSVIS